MSNKPFLIYKVAYNIKWVKTSLTCRITNITKVIIATPKYLFNKNKFHFCDINS